MADAKAAETIIKKVKKGGHGGHHGGAWKVAYADFVTAMMAFFLLLWLLATTTPEQKQGIAEYFTPTVGLKDAKGIGFEGGLTPKEKGSSKSSLSNPGLVAGQVEQGPTPKPPTEAPEHPGAAPEQLTGGPAASKEPAPAAENPSEAGQNGRDVDAEEFKKIQDSLMNAFEQTPELKQLRNNIIITNTPEGLKIDLVEDEQHTMFVPGTTTLTDTGKLMLKAVAGIILRSQNHVSITGHTESAPYPPGAAYTNWELSSDRANSARRYMTKDVLEPERITKVLGMADRELLLPREPGSPRNRRITLMLLRNSHMVQMHQAPAERGLLSVPKLDEGGK